MVYIGIDIAKFKHFASVVSSDGEVIVKPFPFENSRQGFMKLVEEIENFQDCLIGLESTGHYAENLIYFLYERGYQIGVINPIQTDALRDSNIRKTKTDKIDTKLIVQCLMLKKYSLVNSQDINIIKLRRLSRFKLETIQQQTRIKTQLTACLDIVFPELSSFFKGNFKFDAIFSTIPSDVPKISIFDGLCFCNAFSICSCSSSFRNNACFTVSIFVGAFFAESPAII